MTKDKQKSEEQTSELARTSSRFVQKVKDGYNEELSAQTEMTEYEKKLARHLFVKINNQLKQFEKKRSKGKTPYKWQNIDMESLIIDAVHRINLGLDALIPNHIWPIPYYNSNKSKYDLDLQIGYKGKDYYRRKAAVEEPEDVRYELVHENDKFKPIKKSGSQEVETYEFEIQKPFNRGKVVGGFGYIVFDDATKNKLVLVSEEEFKKSKKASKSNFWNDWPERMRYKTLVHRTTEKLQIDPEKINAKSFGYVEQQEVEQLEDVEKKDKKEMQGNKDFVDFQEAEDVEPEEEPEDKEDQEQPKQSEEKTEQKEEDIEREF